MQQWSIWKYKLEVQDEDSRGLLFVSLCATGFVEDNTREIVSIADDCVNTITSFEKQAVRKCWHVWCGIEVWFAF